MLAILAMPIITGKTQIIKKKDLKWKHSTF